MNQTRQGEKIAEGKTKIIWPDAGNDNEVLVESKDDITAGDGIKRDIIQDKGIFSTATISNCFRLLNAAGIPTHFIERVGKRTFRARRVEMIPIELVARRIATGSYLKRNPETEEGAVFEELKIEFFLKDDARHDPLMVWNEKELLFSLFDAKKPLSADSIGTLWIEELLPLGTIEEKKEAEWWKRTVPELIELIRKVFLLLEQAWANQDVALVDLKIEAGIDMESGKLLLADVIDNDSWRIWPEGDKAQMMDKQVYRDLGEATAEAMSAIERKYAWVAKATAKFLSEGE